MIDHEPNSPVVPVLVIGMNRSGTKWISNLICNHPLVAGIQHERQSGILESNFFGTMQHKFGSLEKIDDYIGCLELWSLTDFFKISNLQKEDFYRIKPRPTNCFQLFSILMNNFAENNMAKFWLQKTSPINADNFLEYFRKGNLVLIQRNLFDTLKSDIYRFEKENYWILLKKAFSYALQLRIIKSYSKSKNAVLINYEDLKKDTRKEMTKVCDFLKIPFDKGILEVPYRKNTTFIVVKE